MLIAPKITYGREFITLFSPLENGKSYFKTFVEVGLELSSGI